MLPVTGVALPDNRGMKQRLSQKHMSQMELICLKLMGKVSHVK